MSVLRFLSTVLVTLGLFAFAAASSAQTSVYGTGAVTTFGFSGDNYPGGTSLKPRTTGFTSGAFYTLPSFSRFKAGLDGRYTFSPGYNGGKAYTAAVRFSFVPYRFPVRPYADFGGGVAATQLHQSICNGFGCSQSTSQLISGVVQYGAGLDIHANRLFDIRLPDYQYDTGGRAGVTHAAMHSISAGVVFHLPSRNPNNR